MEKYELADLLYENPLSGPANIEGFKMEGEGIVSFPKGRMRMENLLSPEEGQKSNFVFWCPEEFPANISIEWEFMPLREPGLCIMFFAAMGRLGEDIFDTSLAPRTGEYHLYHHGDINAYHISYFRRRYPEERAFHTCNLRKSYGSQMVCQGADPIPSVQDVEKPYHIRLIYYNGEICFYINGLMVLSWQDDGKTYGPVLTNGKIGFRQMAPLIAEYSNLKVYRVREKNR